MFPRCSSKLLRSLVLEIPPAAFSFALSFCYFGQGL